MSTQKEKLWASLKCANGASLLKHPTLVFMSRWLTVDTRQVRTDMTPATRIGQQIENRKVIGECVVEIVVITMTVEELNALLRESNEQSDISLTAITTAYNKIKSISEVLVPDLHKITVDIRQSRQTVEMEMRDALKWLTTVREFFLESKYELEMKRLREFIELCKEIQALKDAGTLDAVADLAVKLAIGRAQ
jgi:hypothetical protein